MADTDVLYDQYFAQFKALSHKEVADILHDLVTTNEEPEEAHIRAIADAARLKHVIFPLDEPITTKVLDILMRRQDPLFQQDLVRTQWKNFSEQARSALIERGFDNTRALIAELHFDDLDPHERAILLRVEYKYVRTALAEHAPQLGDIELKDLLRDDELVVRSTALRNGFTIGVDDPHLEYEGRTSTMDFTALTQCDDATFAALRTSAPGTDLFR